MFAQCKRLKDLNTNCTSLKKKSPFWSTWAAHPPPKRKTLALINEGTSVAGNLCGKGWQVHRGLGDLALLPPGSRLKPTNVCKTAYCFSFRMKSLENDCFVIILQQKGAHFLSIVPQKVFATSAILANLFRFVNWDMQHASDAVLSILDQDSWHVRENLLAPLCNPCNSCIVWLF